MRKLALLSVAVAAAFALDAQSANASTVYRETFGTATTGGQGATQAWDWAVHTTATAVNSSANTATTPAAINRTLNASKPGATDPIGQVNAGPVIGATPAAYGTGIAFAAPSSGITLFWTPEYAITGPSASGIDPTTNPGLAFKWYQGNANLDGSWAVAVKVAGQWYVSKTKVFNVATVNGATATTFPVGDDDGNGAANHGAELKTYVYDPALANWDQLSFDGTYDMTTHTGASGTILARGATAAADLVGNIDAFGLLGEAGASGNRRFDTFTIVNSLEDVPEPASIAALAAGAALLLRRRR